MTFINTIEANRAEGEVSRMYQAQQGNGNFVPNYARVFSHRPALMSAWAALVKEIRRPVDRRRYELVSLAAAQEIKSSYCSLAFGSKLLKHSYSKEQLQDLLANVDTETLDAKDKAMIRFARKVARDSSSISYEDVEELRKLGFSDEELFDIVVAAAARCFFAKIPDALGVRPDSEYQNLDDSLKQLLVVGRPISEGQENAT